MSERFDPFNVPQELKEQALENKIHSGELVADSEKYHEELRAQFTDKINAYWDNNFETDGAKILNEHQRYDINAASVISNFIKGHGELEQAGWKTRLWNYGEFDLAEPGTIEVIREHDNSSVLSDSPLKALNSFAGLIDHAYKQSPEFKDMSAKDVVEALASSLGYLDRFVKDSGFSSIEQYNDAKSGGKVFKKDNEPIEVDFKEPTEKSLSQQAS